ncbi:hypothetical protein G1K75_08715 [Tenacibaculum finnmarkense]|uniref:hypothetical protein n=1 Tax=Tenacibaculum finnmarkense TaxID=2781243 RepID=UPI001EFB30C2|nr:hypothetical protein [Tenacibaculum finnmarkense]MCG8805738.1 hypothetical protein [Tenacibaculum finnmarkense]MCG8855256.1 hypothetical protein [Tenacibaculum finnmarkense]
MKNLLKPLFIACSAFLIGTTFTSCGDDTGLVEGGETSTEYKLDVTATKLDPVLKINSTANSFETVKVHFEGAENKMRRLYITQSLDGATTELYDVATSNITVELNKDDNSLNLGDEAKDGFTYDIVFKAPTGNNQTYVYQLWTTHGGFANLNSKGDISNPYHKNSYDEGAVGTIIINTGNGIGDVAVTEFTTELSNSIQLNAPDSNGKTQSFVSILNGKTYKITQQNVNSATHTFTDAEKEKNAENVAYWDFGYYYVGGANFASTNVYSDKFEFIDINKISGLNQEQLNKFYFKKSDLDFDAITKNSDLESVTKGSQDIKNVKVNDVIEFVDGKSGAKGVIKINAINGTHGNKDNIKFSVKVQNANFLKL